MSQHLEDLLARGLRTQAASLPAHGSLAAAARRQARVIRTRRRVMVTAAAALVLVVIAVPAAIGGDQGEAAPPARQDQGIEPLIAREADTSVVPTLSDLASGPGPAADSWQESGYGLDSGAVGGYRVVRRPSQDGPPCYAVHRVGVAKLWSSCPRAGATVPSWVGSVGPFSPSGRRVIASGHAGGIGVWTFAIVTTESGAVVRRYEARSGGPDAFGWAVFEDDDHVLVADYDHGRTAIIRCDLRGTCEAATRVRAINLDQWDANPFD